MEIFERWALNNLYVNAHTSTCKCHGFFFLERKLFEDWRIVVLETWYYIALIMSISTTSSSFTWTSARPSVCPSVSFSLSRVLVQTHCCNNTEHEYFIGKPLPHDTLLQYILVLIKIRLFDMSHISNKGAWMI